MTNTYSGTGTYARFGILELQVRSMLRETSEVSEVALKKVSIGLREQYIEQVVVRGLYARGTVGAEMRLTIDWRAYEINLKSGGAMIQVPTSWSNGIAPSLTEGVRTFLLACSEAELGREWSVVYGRHVDRDRVNRKLGFSPASPRQWERPPEALMLGFGPLGEASLVVKLAV